MEAQDIPAVKTPVAELAADISHVGSPDATQLYLNRGWSRLDLIEDDLHPNG